MGKRAGSYVLCVIVVLAVVNAAEGRKLLQAVGSKGYSDDTTAAASSTADNINSAIDSHSKVKPGSSASAANLAVKAQAKKPLVAVTAPQTTLGSRHDSKPTSTATEGAATIREATAASAISGYASGAKPAALPANKASDVPKIAAQMPVGSKTGNTGRQTSLQSATGAAISSSIDDQAKTDAQNAQPGPNVPRPKP